MVKYLRSNWRQIVILSIVIIYTSIGLYNRYLWRKSMYIWVDEGVQISWVAGEKTIPQIISQTMFNIQFPGDYLLIYPFYKLFGADNKWGLAIPHIIITLIGFYLFYVLCKKYFRTIFGYLIAFMLFAYNYNLNYHSFEIRPYSVLITLSIAGFLVFQYIFEERKPSIIKRVFISMFIFAAPFFHVTAAYILFFLYLFHLLFSRGDEPIGHILLRHLKYYGAALVVTLPLLYWYISSSGGVDSGKCDPFEYCGEGIISVLKSVFGNLRGYKKFHPLLLGVIFGFIIPHKGWFKKVMFFIILIIVPIGGIFLAALHFEYWFIQRLYIWAIPLFAFFVGWCWDSVIISATEKFKLFRAKLP